MNSSPTTRRILAPSRWYARLTAGRPTEQKSPTTGDASYTGVSCAGRTARTKGEREMTEERSAAAGVAALAQADTPVFETIVQMTTPSNGRV